MPDLPSVCIVDDDAGFADSLRCLLEAENYRTRIYDGALPFLDDQGWVDCDCLIVDIQMPRMSGLELQDRLASAGHDVPLIVLTGHADVPTAVRALKGGALDFLQKPFCDAEFLAAVARAVDSRRDVTLRQAERAAAAERYATLTPREREVLSEMLTGEPNKVIAHRLGASPRTIEVHRSRVFQKMAVPSLSRLIRIAMETGIGADSDADEGRR
ncbi:two-component system response regulator FixJ [Constrictibacter sp. MBR-5]|jgi:two-component system response regulator FixJ|uniref:response regulator transcription factor n=1 Tax=Constrictibacter sp. MBR-5 TaxID=3156467 RepID=UPI00339276F7